MTRLFQGGQVGEVATGDTCRSTSLFPYEDSGIVGLLSKSKADTAAAAAAAWTVAT